MCVCRCDEGFSGSECVPVSPLSSSVLSDFETAESLLSVWQEVTGGELVLPEQGCGVVSSGSSLYFSKVCVCVCVCTDIFPCMLVLSCWL